MRKFIVLASVIIALILTFGLGGCQKTEQAEEAGGYGEQEEAAGYGEQEQGAAGYGEQEQGAAGYGESSGYGEQK